MCASRLEYVDAYKAFLIVLVVLGHAFQYGVSDFDANLGVKAIYSHHMAAFFFLSGYVTWRAAFRPAALWGKLTRLLTPFFFWWAARWLVCSRTDFIGALHGVLKHPDGGLWFLYVLALCQAVYFGGRIFARRVRWPDAAALAAGAGALMGVEIVTRWDTYGFHFLAWYYMFFALGLVTRQYGAALLERLEGIRLLPLALLVAWGVLLPGWQRNQAIVLPRIGELPTVMAFGYRFVAAACAIGAAFLVFRRWRGAPRAWLGLGRCTLGIYAVQGFVLELVTPVLRSGVAAVDVAAFFVAGLGLSYGVTRALRRVPVLGARIV